MVVTRPGDLASAVKGDVSGLLMILPGGLICSDGLGGAMSVVMRNTEN